MLGDSWSVELTCDTKDSGGRFWDGNLDAITASHDYTFLAAQLCLLKGSRTPSPSHTDWLAGAGL